mmetsp:Transcript_74246/g.172231  ORF Transcript_74246/g.172231 Transcript_74246/m.172231 type:complete len:280 (-) Transcript_74246:460-1299(-)
MMLPCSQSPSPTRATDACCKLSCSRAQRYRPLDASTSRAPTSASEVQCAEPTPRARFSSHWGTTFTPPTTPTVTAEVSLVSQVRFTWKTRMKIPPMRISTVPCVGYAANASHQGGLLVLCRPVCFESPTTPPSSTKEATRQVKEEMASLTLVNSESDMVPRNRPSGRMSSCTPQRSAVTLSPRKIGVPKFTSTGNGAPPSCCVASMLTITVPTERNSADMSSSGPTCSLFKQCAKVTVQKRSVACSNRWVPVGTSCSPQLVTAYFRPKQMPTGATYRSL